MATHPRHVTSHHNTMQLSQPPSCAPHPSSPSPGLLGGCHGAAARTQAALPPSHRRAHFGGALATEPSWLRPPGPHALEPRRRTCAAGCAATRGPGLRRVPQVKMARNLQFVLGGGSSRWSLICDVASTWCLVPQRYSTVMLL